MAAEAEFRCFVGGLSWGTDEQILMDEFREYQATEAKVILDRETGRSRGFGYVTFTDKRDMDDAIEAMNGKEVDGRTITVNVAQPRKSSAGGGGGRYSDGDRGGGDRRGGGGGGGNGCFSCGDPGHWARDCPTGGGGRGGGGGGGSRDYGDRRGGGGDGDRYGSSKSGDRYGSSDRYNGGSSDRYGGKSSGGPSRYEGKSDRSAPYDRPSGGSSRSREDRSRDDRY